MVSTSVIIAMCVTLFISLIFPVILYIVYGVRNKGKGVWTAWLLGAAGFFVMQVLIRIPVLSILSGSAGFVNFAESHYVLYCLFMAFTAGLFEAAGRYAAARIMKKKLTYERGIAAGLGHGGIEAMILIGMTYVNNLIYTVLINSGSFDGLVEQTQAMGVDTSSLTAVKDILTGSGSVLYYLAGYERLLTMVFHTVLSLLVCYFVWKGKDLKGILICLALHCGVDFVSPVINGLSTEYLGNVISANTAYILVYVFLTAVAAAGIAIIWRFKKKWKGISP